MYRPFLRRAGVHKDPDTAKGFFIGFPHVIFTYAAHLARIEVVSAARRRHPCLRLPGRDRRRRGDQSADVRPADPWRCCAGHRLRVDGRRGDPRRPGGQRRSDDLPDTRSARPARHRFCRLRRKRGKRAARNERRRRGGDEQILPAIANALDDACAIRLRHAPFAPDKVLAALEETR